MKYKKEILIISSINTFKHKQRTPNAYINIKIWRHDDGDDEQNYQHKKLCKYKMRLESLWTVE